MIMRWNAHCADIIADRNAHRDRLEGRAAITQFHTAIQYSRIGMIRH